MHIVELISTGDGQIMETLDSVGIKLFLLVVVSFIILLFVCAV